MTKEVFLSMKHYIELSIVDVRFEKTPHWQLHCTMASVYNILWIVWGCVSLYATHRMTLEALQMIETYFVCIRGRWQCLTVIWKWSLAHKCF